jgi:hypothetical protein
MEVVAGAVFGCPMEFWGLVFGSSRLFDEELSRLRCYVHVSINVFTDYGSRGRFLVFVNSCVLMEIISLSDHLTAAREFINSPVVWINS